MISFKVLAEAEVALKGAPVPNPQMGNENTFLTINVLQLLRKCTMLN